MSINFKNCDFYKKNIHFPPPPLMETCRGPPLMQSRDRRTQPIYNTNETNGGLSAAITVCRSALLAPKRFTFRFNAGRGAAEGQ